MKDKKRGKQVRRFVAAGKSAGDRYWEKQRKKGVKALEKRMRNDD